MIVITSKAPGIIDVQTMIDARKRRQTGLLPAGGEGGIPVGQMPRIGDMVEAPAPTQNALGAQIYPVSTGEPPPAVETSAEAPPTESGTGA